jgi:hypothetical protein
MRRLKSQRHLSASSVGLSATTGALGGQHDGSISPPQKARSAGQVGNEVDREASPYSSSAQHHIDTTC